MDYLFDIANFAKTFRNEDADEDVRERAKLIILDSLTTIAFGNQHSEALKLTEKLLSSKKEECNEEGFIFGTGNCIDYKTAALINGIAIVTDELDEGNPFAKGHPSCHFLPSFLSIALREKVSGNDFLTAFIISYEITARMGAAVTQSALIHPHGNWGVFGNGFGLGRLLRWEEAERYIQATMLSMSFSMPTLWQSVLEGHKVRNAIIGLNNLHTTLIPELIDSGFSASLLTPEVLFNEVLSEQIRFDSLVENLGETYYLLKSYFKFYSYCRFCHSPVDAVIDLIQDVQIEDIKEIRVYTYSSAARLHERKVNNEFAGKFSIPYAVASEICKHQYPLLDSSLLENKICKLIEKVFVEEEKSYTDMLPGKRVTTVELELLNGNIKGKTVQRAMGDADEENLFEKVISKNREFLNPIIGEDRANTLIKKILSIEEQNDLSFLAQLRR